MSSAGEICNAESPNKQSLHNVWGDKMKKDTNTQTIASNILEAGLQDLGRRAVAKKMGISERQARYALEMLRQPVEEVAPEPEKPAKKEKAKPVRISSIAELAADVRPGTVFRVILTAAQDDTPVHLPFLRNLEAYADWIGAYIAVGGYTYQKGLFEDHSVATAAYAPEIRKYMVYDRARFGRDLLFVADANVLPTAANPLTGWMTANRGGHVVVPHARIALDSIPRMLEQGPRFAITTGCCTIPSYAPRAAGRKAIQHHAYGALLVEIDTDGQVFFGQLIADETGNFQDLDRKATDGVVTTGHPVEALTYADIHHDQLDQQIGLASFGYDRAALRFLDRPNLIDRLRPSYQFLHDTLDFRVRNHHNIDDPISMAKMAARGTISVEREIAEAAAFASGVQRPWSTTIIVESNHDSAVAKWLRGEHGREDPDNAYLWHRFNADWHDAIRAHNDNFNVTEHAFRRLGLHDDVYFCPAGSSCLLADVEHGLHGDLGIGGSKGSPLQYRRFGRKVTSAHTHTPKIAEGSYVAGVSAKLFQGYNIGPTTWAHAHVVLYSTGIRSMLIMASDGRCRAVGDQIEMRMAA